MYAVIETGGKQYRVEPGDVLDIELLKDVGHRGSEIEFERVLMVSGDGGVQIGSPLVDGVKVSAELLDRVRSPKILVFKMKRRKGYRRMRGHRQDLMRIRIKEFQA